MKAKTSKETADREKACRYVLTAFFRQGPEISRLLADLFQPQLQEGDPEPSFFGPIVAFGRGLKNGIDRVVRADKVLFAANAAHDAALQSRDRRSSDLGRRIGALRSVCKALFVDLAVQNLGFDQRTAQDPVPLLTQAERVVEHLRADTVSKAQHLFEGDEFDPRKYADHLERVAGELRESLDQVAETRRHAEEVMLEKRAVTDEYDDLFRDATRAFESYCRMVGKVELADRVRPSKTHPGRTVVADRQTEEPETEKSAGDKPDLDESSEASAS